MGEKREERGESAGVGGGVEGELGDASGGGVAEEAAGEGSPAREGTGVDGKIPGGETGPRGDGGGFDGGFEGFEGGDVGRGSERLNDGGGEKEKEEEGGEDFHGGERDSCLVVGLWERDFNGGIGGGGFEWWKERVLK